MIRAKNMMTSDVITISSNAGVVEAARLIASKSVSSLVVVEKNMPIAVLSGKDIIRGVLTKKMKVRDIMDKNFFVVAPITSFYKINQILKEKNIARFPVVEDGKLIGLITETDVVEATRDFTRFHQILQDLILAIFGIATAFFLFYFSPIGRLLFG